MTSGTCAFEVPRTGNRHQPFLVAARVEFGTGNRHVPFFPSCPAWSSAWSSELEAGMSHFFGVAPRGVPRGVPLNPGVTTGLKEAILEFFSWESLGAGWQGFYAGQARPGFYAGQLGPRSHWQKTACCSSPPTGGLEVFSGKNPDLGAGRAGAAGLLCQARHQAEPSQCSGPFLYVLYVLYLTRQATEHPLTASQGVWSTARLDFLVPPGGIAKLHFGAFGGSLPGLVQQSAGTLDLYSMQIRASAFEKNSVSVTDLLADSLALTATLDGLTAQGNAGCDQLLRNDVNCTDVFTSGVDASGAVSGAALTAGTVAGAALSSTGAVSGSSLSISGAASVGLLSSATGITGSTLTINNMANAGNFTTVGDVSTGTLTASGAATAASFAATGALTGATLTITGAASAGPLDCESLDCTFTATSGGVSTGSVVCGDDELGHGLRAASNTLTVTNTSDFSDDLFLTKNWAGWSKLQVSNNSAAPDSGPELRLLGNQSARVFLERDGGRHQCELIMINDEALAQTKSLSTQLSLTTNQRNPGCLGATSRCLSGLPASRDARNRPLFGATSRCEQASSHPRSLAQALFWGNKAKWRR